MQTSSKPQRSHLMLINVFDESAFKYRCKYFVSMVKSSSEEVLSLLLYIVAFVKIFLNAQKNNLYDQRHYQLQHLFIFDFMGFYSVFFFQEWLCGMYVFHLESYKKSLK